MTSKIVSKKLRFLSCFIGIIVAFSSFIAPPSSMRFFPMLMNRADVANLMANSSFSYIVLINSNYGADDASRLSFQLACYAFNTSNQLMASYSPLKLTKSIPDSAYAKDIFVSSYKITKASLATIIPTTTYSFLRFAPYGDRADPLLANFINYSVFPVGADGVTGIVVGKGIPVIKLNPSPPR